MPDADADLQRFLPLSAATFHVLVALAGEELHGYAILKEVAERTGGEVELATGTLYGIVKRLLEEGWIAESRRRSPLADPRRRTYRLTDLGRRVVTAEAERLEGLVAMARSRNLLAAPASNTRRPS
jgi:DNA-binding PadR family transcriptional regulator